MIVVDTNILIHALVESQRTEAVRQLRALDPSWRLPSLWRWEFTNVIWMKVKAGGLSKEAAQGLMTTATAHFEAMERPVSMTETLAMALEFSVTGYDASFLALAKRLDVPLVTEDKKLRRVAGARAWSIEEYLARE